MSKSMLQLGAGFTCVLLTSTAIGLPRANTQPTSSQACLNELPSIVVALDRADKVLSPPDLESLFGTYVLNSQVNAINDRGVSVGTATTIKSWYVVGNTQIPVSWGRSGSVTALSPVPFNFVVYRSRLIFGNPLITANGLNNQGQAVGSANGKPALFEQGNYHLLDEQDGAALAINDSGDSVGFSMFDGTSSRAALFSNGITLNLGTLPGSVQSRADSVNQQQVIVGRSSFSNQSGQFARNQAVIFSKYGQPEPLKGLPPEANSAAIAVNNLNQIVGAASFDGSSTEHAFIYQDGRFQNLGTLPGRTGSIALGINDLGDVVGASASRSFIPTADQPSVAAVDLAFLYHNGQMIDLNSLLDRRSQWVLRQARAINNQGEIVGEGQLNGNFRPFLLTKPCLHGQ